MTQHTILFLTHSEPTPVGNGGNHRSYQIYHDLRQIVSGDHEDQIKVLVRPGNDKQLMQNVSKRAVRSSRRASAKHRIKMMVNRLGKVRENPFNLVATTAVSFQNYVTRDFVANYERMILADKPRLTIIDHVGFAPIIDINRKHGIPTIACPQNLESLDASSSLHSRWDVSATAQNLANELEVLKQCEACLCISKIETALLNGLGYKAEYYAYQPVAAVKETLMRIRQNRLVNTPERGLFVMPGSAFHHSTREGMLWLLHQIEQHPLPDDIQIAIFGAQSHTLPTVAGVTAYGWIEQAQFEAYMTSATAVLIPQFRGFGAPTKLIECAVAGVPIIAADHIVSAIDPLPRLHITAQRWESWLKTMRSLMNEPIPESSPVLPAASPLCTLIQQMLN